MPLQAADGSGPLHRPSPPAAPPPALSEPHAGEPDEASSIASLLGAAWDPEGLLAKGGASPVAAGGGQMGDLIARKESERAARRAAAAAAAAAANTRAAEAAAAAAVAPAAPAAPPAGKAEAVGLPPLPPGLPPAQPLPAELAAVATPAGGILAGQLRPQDVPAASQAAQAALRAGATPAAAFAAFMVERFMPVDLDWPGLQIMHLDPPVFLIDGFMSADQCKDIIRHAVESGRLGASRIGAANASDSYATAASTRRTSSSMLLTPGVAGGAMDALVAAMHARASRLFLADKGPMWGAPGRLPKPGQYCYESLQCARYEVGQHFLAHDDAFPKPLAASNGFQRHATLLLYLCDCQQGGATSFDYLGLKVPPRQGKALLFFPAFADGTPDSRTLHTAEDAVDTKWVTQQWIARGYVKPAPPPPASATAAAAAPATMSFAAAGVGAAQQGSSSVVEELLEQQRGKRKGGKGGAAKKAGKGFAAK